MMILAVQYQTISDLKNMSKWGKHLIKLNSLNRCICGLLGLMPKGFHPVEFS